MLDLASQRLVSKPPTKTQECTMGDFGAILMSFGGIPSLIEAKRNVIFMTQVDEASAWGRPKRSLRLVPEDPGDPEPLGTRRRLRPKSRVAHPKTQIRKKKFHFGRAKLS